MFSPPESIDVHWFGKARAGLELLGKQKTTPPRVLVGSRDQAGGIGVWWDPMSVGTGGLQATRGLQTK